MQEVSIRLYEVSFKMGDRLLVVRVLASNRFQATETVMGAPGPVYTPLNGKTPREARCEFQTASLVTDTSQPKILSWQVHKRL